MQSQIHFALFLTEIPWHEVKWLATQWSRCRTIPSCWAQLLICPPETNTIPSVKFVGWWTCSPCSNCSPCSPCSPFSTCSIDSIGSTVLLDFMELSCFPWLVPSCVDSGNLRFLTLSMADVNYCLDCKLHPKNCSWNGDQKSWRAVVVGAVWVSEDSRGFQEKKHIGLFQPQRALRTMGIS